MKVKLEDVCTNESSNLIQRDIESMSGEYPVYGAAGYIKNINTYKQDKAYIGIVKDGAGVGRTMLLPSKSSVIGTLQYILPKENIDIGYLNYALIKLNLAKYASGATIPHIYFKDYKKEVFELPELKEQKKVVSILNRVSYIISLRRQQLEKLDILVKSRFVEMFGDPVKNDKNWKTNFLVEVTNKIGSGATPKGGKESYQSEGISLIRSLNVHDGQFLYEDLAYITDIQAKELDNVKIEANDVFINITGASVARSCIVPNDVLPARVNQHVSIIRCKHDILHHVFMNQMFLNLSYKRHLLTIGEAGGATRQAITKQQLEKLIVIVPPLSLQNQFADFVQQVDKSKFAIKKSLEKLELLKKKLMQDYFGD